MTGERLSEFFAWGEVTRSSKAVELGIDNSLPSALRRDAKLLHDRVLYPLRHYLNAVVHVESWYRCDALNAAVGGSVRSLHRIARACDIYTHSHTPAEIVTLAKALALPLDQIINEYGRYCHMQIARDGKRPRLMVLTAHKVDGKTGEVTRYASGSRKVDPITRRLA